MVIESDGAIYPSGDPNNTTNTYGGLRLTNKDFSAGLWISGPSDSLYGSGEGPVPSGTVAVSGDLRVTKLVETPDHNITISSSGNEWTFKGDATVSLPSNTLDAGGAPIDIKSSDYAELYFQSGPSGTPSNYIENTNYNSASYIWTSYDGTYIELVRDNDGTNPFWDHRWDFTNDGNLHLPGNILLPNGTTVATGTFDNGTGGNHGISLNCYVGYELNWQGGHLKSSSDGGWTAANIWCDSPIEFPGSGVDNVEINSDGIIFSDGTTQNSANISSSNITDFNNAVSGLVDGVYAPLVHTHEISNVSGLQTALDSKQPSGNYSLNGHSHTVSDITNFGSGVSGLLPVTNIVAGTGISVTNNSGAFTINTSAIISNPSGIPGATAITNIVQISQTDYDNLVSTDPNTIYIINT